MKQPFATIFRNSTKETEVAKTQQAYSGMLGYILNADKRVQSNGQFKPVGGSRFDGCVADMQSKGHSKESATRICGKIAQEKAANSFERIGEMLINSAVFPATFQLTTNSLMRELNYALDNDGRFKTTGNSGYSVAPSRDYWVCDVLIPINDGDNDEDDGWVAVLQKNSLYFKIGFTLNDAGRVTLSPLPPVETNMVYTNSRSVLNTKNLMLNTADDPGAATRAAAEGGAATDPGKATRDADDLDEDPNKPTREEADGTATVGKNKTAAPAAATAAAPVVGPVGETAPNSNSGSK